MSESAKKSLQELADARLAPEYRQPVKTIDEAMAAIGWSGDHPVCCGEVVNISSFLGSPYQGVCRLCNRFVFDVTGPEFGNSYVQFPSDEYDLESERRWVSGQRLAEPRS